MKRIFITGGTGFFGKSILSCRARGISVPPCECTILSRDPERFRRDNPELADQEGLHFVQGDIRNFEFPGGPFDVIVHAATPAVTTLSDSEMESIILDGTRRVIEFAGQIGCKTILFTSSGAVYGPRFEPSPEDTPCRPATAYGKSKLQAERMLVDSGLSIRIARCFAFVGAYLPRSIHYAIGNFIRDAIAGVPIVVHGDGTPLRSYLYSDDLVEWLFAILERGEPGIPYNVGSDQAISIRHLAETVRDVLSPGLPIEVRGTPSSTTPPSVYVPDVSRAASRLGLSVKTDLRTSIIRSSRKS